MLGFGPTVTSATDGVALVFDAAKLPRSPEIRSAATADPLAVEVADVDVDVDDVAVAETVVVDGVAETVVVDAVAEIVMVDGVAETVTVSGLASESALPACGIIKFGAKLIEGW